MYISQFAHKIKISFIKAVRPIGTIMWHIFTSSLFFWEEK